MTLASRQVSGKLCLAVQENASLMESKGLMEKKMAEMHKEQEARAEIFQAYETKMHDATQQLIHMKNRLDEAVQVRVYGYFY